MIRYLFLFACYFTLLKVHAQGEYFGQNKTRNRTNTFQVLRSNHFDLYHYLPNESLREELLRNSESWYRHHQAIFKMAFLEPNPLIIYNSHPDFQETTVIGGQIGEGTGGVTEGFKTRVVMPLFFTKKQTDHVLGHEMVHVFQYQTMTYGSDSTRLENMSNIPLFMTEGLAEYLSLGRNDPHTALWMRDAVLHNDLPSIEDLVVKQNKYFPYRWGQAFWAYVTGLYGDEIIRPLYKQVAIYGIREAFVRIFRMDLDAFSAKFKNDLKQYYTHFESNRVKTSPHELLASGDINISPALSPDGKYLAYVSSKDVLSMNVYIADTKTKKVIKKINTDGFGQHVDSYSFIESTLTWSPDNKKVALVIQSKSKNKLLILDAFQGDKREYALPDLDAFTHPAWSPHEEIIALSGMKNGQVDLYLYHLRSGKLEAVTSDRYSDVQPAWAPDGEHIYFVTDRGGSERLEKEKLKIAKINLKTKAIEILPLFSEVDLYNPQVSPDGKKVYFLASPDGFRDIYQWEDKQISRLTNFYTGITGITAYSPALSVASRSGDLVYNLLDKGKYNLALLPSQQINAFEVQTRDTGAGILPPGRITRGEDMVTAGLMNKEYPHVITKETYKDVPYKGKFKLDYLANSGISAGVSRFGAGMAGGVMGLFSDMLNNNQVAATVAVNGELEDFGGQVYYLNQKNKWQYGFAAGHIPYRLYGGYSLTAGDTVSHSSGLTYMEGMMKERIVRLFIDQASGFLMRPISRQTRFELGVNSNWYTYSAKDYPRYGLMGVTSTGRLVDFITTGYGKTERVDKETLSLEGFHTTQIFGAMVGDNTTFGSVAPLKGYRYRLEASRFFGSTAYNQLLVDVRQYQYLKPLTIAGRVYYEGRLNPKNLESLNRIYPLYLGYPWYVHGLDKNMFIGSWNQVGESSLSGEQMALANVELRLPFTGHKKLALIPFQYVASDLNLFFDTGMTWSTKKVNIPEGQTESKLSKNNAVMSLGASLRMNVLGYLIIEPYIAYPYRDRQWQGQVTGINFMIAGW
ncbi:DPP IV N-terminal domain-containing protein [Leadbetterella byssophila]|uniref:DPP IV N-terminal domain-containing protein n=1 Tax=Leadbetterella byssophila TaxID=316068 RepID=UPI0039A12219